MKSTTIYILLFLLCYQINAQNILKGNERGKRGDLRILFYNVENHFDCFDDSLRMDNEFLPMGEKAWTFEKYRKKAQRIGKVIMAAGEWEFPDVIGLCEVENRFTIEGIFQFGPMNNISYEVIHKESPDRRGIDVALVYQPERFQILDTNFLKVCYRQDTISSTREILYVKGMTNTMDTLHFFVNHWPSRWGGQLNSEHKRLSAAQVLRRKVDEISSKNGKAKIIIMGDFNDYPTNKSLMEVLSANEPNDHPNNKSLYNLAFPYTVMDDIGSHKYKGKWGMMDQFIVSGALINKSGTLYCSNTGMSLFAPDFLLIPDRTYYGYKPFRTFVGYKYQGGFSDHLPIVLDLWRK
jgi:predicted extracellular nuclease